MKLRGIVFCVLALSLAAQESKHSDEVRIGVLGLFHPVKVVVHKLSGHALQCGFAGRKHLVDDRVQVRAVDFSPADDRESRFSCDDGVAGETEFVVSIPGKISRNYRGKLEIRCHADRIVAVVTMKLETAVASVVAAESPPDAPLEALKAEAVAARSYLVAGKGSHNDFDFCDTTHCQFLRAPPLIDSLPYNAAAQTRGLVLTYRNTAFAAMYSASCSGRTHSLQELGIPVHGYPYFGVVCDYCRRHPQRWSARLGDDEAAALTGTEISRIRLARKLGWSSVPSNSYQLERDGGTMVLRGVGFGHGVGLCQRGAGDMARRGSSFAQILAHYYPNTALQQLP